mgnify:CR=1 FL=1
MIIGKKNTKKRGTLTKEPPIANKRFSTNKDKEQRNNEIKDISFLNPIGQYIPNCFRPLVEHSSNRRVSRRVVIYHVPLQRGAHCTSYLFLGEGRNVMNQSSFGLPVSLVDAYVGAERDESRPFGCRHIFFSFPF